ncbi:ATP-dependent nuclease [Myroides odoratimimus]|uniref:ATP-dependent nuclease n=1 Tax=Myroides odoratimimus TaxID=76832 RepID=UPI003101A85D
MHETESRTNDCIAKEFEELSDEFCSLGQSIDFYKNLKKKFSNEDFFYQVLQNLNDIAFLPVIKEKFENNYTFKRSLIRTSEAEKAYYQARYIIEGISIENAFKFSYKCKLANTEGEHKVSFNFGDMFENSDFPSRLIAIIGKNGTGKTQFLAQLALDLSGQTRKVIAEDTFKPSRPLFSKVIAVSYSIFDKFSRPKKDKAFSYKYCGLKSENGGLLSSIKVTENYKESVEGILSLDRDRNWTRVMREILGEDLAKHYYTEIFENKNFAFVSDPSVRLLSSGQSFLMYVITEILANIRENSLLLFDEPEMHLHPNAVSSFIRMLDVLLNQFDSYAIVATHSPIILQEIPSRYVKVFDRVENLPYVRSLAMESFGENLDELTEEIFQVKDNKGTYKEVFQKLSENLEYEEVLELFDNKLSLNAKTYLYNLYNEES